MSIFEYDEKVARRVIRREAYEDGMAMGELHKTILMVCKKLKKNKTLEEIAGDLEEEVSVIAPIYHVAEKFAPEYAPDKVFECMSTDI